MKHILKGIIECTAVAVGVLIIIHRRVIAACITGDPMPEPPEWHKRCFRCLSGTSDK